MEGGREGEKEVEGDGEGEGERKGKREGGRKGVKERELIESSPTYLTCCALIAYGPDLNSGTDCLLCER